MRAALLACVSVLTLALAFAQDPPARTENELRADLVNALTSERWDDVIAAARGLIARNERDGQAWVNLGYALHALGRVDEALEAHRRAAQLPGVAGIGAYNIACVYALRGDPDQAFAWLRKAMAAGGMEIRRVREDSDLKSLHDDPRFKEFLADLVRDAAHEASSQRATASVADRREARLVFNSATGSAGQINLDWGPVAWKPEFEANFTGDSLTERRWRFGKDSWTSWDASVTVAFGDKKLPAGQYYVMLTRQPRGSLALVFLDAAIARDLRLDAMLAHTTRGGLEIPVRHDPTTSTQERLELSFVPDPEHPTHAALEATFGTHKLSVPFTVEFGV
jgi:tetratricopeptide (TPR) repeat protein